MYNTLVYSYVPETKKVQINDLHYIHGSASNTLQFAS